ncbi:MAG: type II secretion system protein GspE, partial [Sphingorhabdus sp.]|nr:type II secretion system protein GspE [Sphingorhabdus sp.]
MKIAKGSELDLKGDEAARDAAPSTDMPKPPLLDIPYSFARDHGVLLTETDGTRLQVAMRDGADPAALLEVRRYLAMPFDVDLVDGPAFAKLLSEHYAMDGSAAAMADSMGDHALDDIAG